MAETTQIALRISSEMVKQIDELATELEKVPRYAPTGKMSRSDCIRTLIIAGMDAINQELKEEEG